MSKKQKPGIVDVNGRYLGDVDTSSEAQMELAKSVIRNVREAELTGQTSAKSKADALYAQYQNSSLSSLERRQLAPMVGTAIKMIQKVGAVSDTADMFAHKNGQNVSGLAGSSRTRSAISGVYELATQVAKYEIDDTPPPEAA